MIPLVTLTRGFLLISTRQRGNIDGGSGVGARGVGIRLKLRESGSVTSKRGFGGDAAGSVLVGSSSNEGGLACTRVGG
jgi:hypothetical protein